MDKTRSSKPQVFPTRDPLMDGITDSALRETEMCWKVPYMKGPLLEVPCFEILCPIPLAGLVFDKGVASRVLCDIVAWGVPAESERERKEGERGRELCFVLNN